jgi:hypothetical protein
MQIRKHDSVSRKQQAQPYFYDYWYVCVQEDCKTNTVLDEKYRIWNNSRAGHHVRRKLAMRRKETARQRLCRMQAQLGGRPATKPWQSIDPKPRAQSDQTETAEGVGLNKQDNDHES